MKEHNIQRICFSSSATVYGKKLIKCTSFHLIMKSACLLGLDSFYKFLYFHHVENFAFYK